MNSFEYASPGTVETAIRLLGPEAAVLAGGTDLLSLIKDGAVKPVCAGGRDDLAVISRGDKFDPAIAVEIIGHEPLAAEGGIHLDHAPGTDP